ncbi:hypothetical protein [Lapillicoccus jejuensis]|uniref:Acetone carboxylase n=1 Tax=Lapillicoccus jejuensis TaxID=402171 RepID=A0A542E4B8_9MICO|nr:hypothetical protein [Lapillicoccus jejuensis]TQJ10193.1 hypothetical protein FB458_3312 [Lapillicoccus jejuensis]
MTPELLCSAKGCRQHATTGLRWNNPRLHDADRRKVWLACDEHVGSLSDFLSMRGFLRDAVPVGELEPADG